MWRHETAHGAVALRLQLGWSECAAPWCEEMQQQGTAFLVRKSGRAGQLAWWLGDMRGVVFLAVLCCLGGSEHAWSETPQPGLSPHVACANAQTTAAMRECEMARYKRAEAGMTAAYHSLLTKLGARGRAKLQRAQQAWRTFRDAEAALQANTVRGGTLAPLLRTSVLADMTESRWQQLMQEAQALDK